MGSGLYKMERNGKGYIDMIIVTDHDPKIPPRDYQDMRNVVDWGPAIVVILSGVKIYLGLSNQASFRTQLHVFTLCGPGAAF